MTTNNEKDHIAGRRAFAAMHAALKREQTHKLFVMDTQQQYEHVRNFFDIIGIQYERVTVHLHPGQAVALRVSTTAAIFLATLKFIQPN